MTQPTRNIILLVVTGIVLSVTATFSAPPGDARQVSAPTPPTSGETATVTRVAHRGGGLLQFSHTSYRVRESGGHATIRVERLGSLNGTVTVAYATSPGTALAGLNYQAAAGTLTFAEGVKTQRFVVPVLLDGQVTGNKTVFLTLSAPAGGARLGPQRRAVLAIVNTDVGLTGTAAAGAPLASRLIKIKDKNGARRTGTTTTEGQFSVTVTGLAPTFLVKVEPPGVSSLPGPAGQAVVLGRAGPPVATPLGLGSRAALTPVTVLDPQTTALFSVGTAEAGVVNVHPFTDLIIRTWYQVQGTTVESVFDAPTTDPPAPSAEQVAVIASLVKDMLNIWLTANGLDPITFDLIATPFDADGAGFDAVLEAATLATETQTTTVTLTNAATSVTQTTALSVADKILSALTTTTGTGGASSGGLTSGVVPTDPAVQTALDGVLQTLSNLRTVINSRGAALTANDLLPFFDANYLNDGLQGPQLGAADLATHLRGLQLNSFTVQQIRSYDDVNKVINVVPVFLLTVNGRTVEQVIDFEEGFGFSFKQQTDGTWRWFGNQQQVSLQVHVETENRTGLPDTSDNGVFKDLFFVVSGLEGTIAGASVTGTDGLTQTLANQSISRVLTFRPTPTTTQEIRLVQFQTPFGSEHVQSFPPVGTVYTFTVTLLSGGQRVYTRTVNATTTESVAITNLTGHTLADAHLGQPLTVQWTLPVTFPIQFITLGGGSTVLVPNGQGGTDAIDCNADEQPLPITATSGTVTLPTTCGGQPVNEARVNFIVQGTHGEQTTVAWFFF